MALIVLNEPKQYKLKLNSDALFPITIDYEMRGGGGGAGGGSTFTNNTNNQLVFGRGGDGAGGTVVKGQIELKPGDSLYIMPGEGGESGLSNAYDQSANTIGAGRAGKGAIVNLDPSSLSSYTMRFGGAAGGNASSESSSSATKYGAGGGGGGASVLILHRSTGTKHVIAAAAGGGGGAGFGMLDANKHSSITGSIFKDSTLDSLSPPTPTDGNALSKINSILSNEPKLRTQEISNYASIGSQFYYLIDGYIINSSALLNRGLFIKGSSKPKVSIEITIAYQYERESGVNNKTINPDKIGQIIYEDVKLADLEVAISKISTHQGISSIQVNSSGRYSSSVPPTISIVKSGAIESPSAEALMSDNGDGTWSISSVNLISKGLWQIDNAANLSITAAGTNEIEAAVFSVTIEDYNPLEYAYVKNYTIVKKYIDALILPLIRDGSVYKALDKTSETYSTPTVFAKTVGVGMRLQPKFSLEYPNVELEIWGRSFVWLAKTNNSSNDDNFFNIPGVVRDPYSYNYYSNSSYGISGAGGGGGGGGIIGGNGGNLEIPYMKPRSASPGTRGYSFSSTISQNVNGFEITLNNSSLDLSVGDNAYGGSGGVSLQGEQEDRSSANGKNGYVKLDLNIVNTIQYKDDQRWVTPQNYYYKLTSSETGEEKWDKIRKIFLKNQLNEWKKVYDSEIFYNVSFSNDEFYVYGESNNPAPIRESYYEPPEPPPSPPAAPVKAPTTVPTGAGGLTTTQAAPAAAAIATPPSPPPPPPAPLPPPPPPTTPPYYDAYATEQAIGYTQPRPMTTSSYNYDADATSPGIGTDGGISSTSTGISPGASDAQGGLDGATG